MSAHFGRRFTPEFTPGFSTKPQAAPTDHFTRKNFASAISEPHTAKHQSTLDSQRTHSTNAAKPASAMTTNAATSAALMRRNTLRMRTVSIPTKFVAYAID